jgi:hypothetical protein
MVSSGYVVSNDRVSARNGFEGCGKKRSLILLGNLCGRSWAKATNLTRDRRSPGGEWNPRTLKYEAERILIGGEVKKCENKFGYSIYNFRMRYLHFYILHCP